MNRKITSVTTKTYTFNEPVSIEEADAYIAHECACSGNSQLSSQPQFPAVSDGVRNAMYVNMSEDDVIGHRTIRECSSYFKPLNNSPVIGITIDMAQQEVVSRGELKFSTYNDDIYPETVLMVGDKPCCPTTDIILVGDTRAPYGVFIPMDNGPMIDLLVKPDVLQCMQLAALSDKK